MRVFHREFGYRYDTYEFGYATYASLEKNDRLADVYGAGFLPHSADPTVQDLFYMARSVRIPLTEFTLTSENRRVQNKFADLFTPTTLTQKELLEDLSFLPCFLSYFAERHGERVMSEERARGILSSSRPLSATRYSTKEGVAGYVLEIRNDTFSHYWYSCYTPEYSGTSFGMWLMLDAVQRAQKDAKEYMYLGTAYGSKGRYKTNFKPLQFWDGSVWNTDLSVLKERIGGSE